MIRKKPWSCRTASHCCDSAGSSKSLRPMKSMTILQLPTQPNSSDTPICCEQKFEAASHARVPSLGQRRWRMEIPCFHFGPSAFGAQARIRMQRNSERELLTIPFTEPANCCTCKLQKVKHSQ